MEQICKNHFPQVRIMTVLSLQGGQASVTKNF